MWMNAIALIITALPEPYWKMVFQLIVKELQESDFLTIPHAADVNPFDVRIRCLGVHFCLNYLLVISQLFHFKNFSLEF